MIISNWRTSINERKVGLSHLKELLINHKTRINKMVKTKDKDLIYSPFSEIPYYNIIHSKVFVIKKDKELLLKLYIHIENLEGINRALRRQDVLSGGFTSSQGENYKGLKDGIQEILPECITELDNCITEINTKL
jgi:hypothetical protein